MANLPEANYRELLLLLLRRRRRFKITGASMLPILHPGDEILIDPFAYRKSLPKVGDLVVATHPHHDKLTIVKRVSAVDADGKCFLTGDNLSVSTDSRQWGAIAATDLLGKVTCYFL